MFKRQFISKIFAFLVGLGCIYIAYEYNSKSNTILNGSIYGTYWTLNSTEYVSDKHSTNIKNILNRIDYIASNYKEDSEVAIVNNAPLNTFINISEELHYLIELSTELNTLTNGAYDITLGKISAKNGFSPNFGKDLIIKNDVNNKKYDINSFNLIKYQNFWFDLSSLAKGYAVQEIHNYLQENNFKNYLIDIGGEIIANGLNQGNPWIIGIQDPQLSSNNIILSISNKNLPFLSIATSGEYRNFKYVDGILLTHTINPSTNKSIKNKLKSVSVVSTVSADIADAYATALNVMGLSSAMDFADKNEIAALFIVDRDGSEKIIKSKKWYDLKL
ncbi:MAG: FAD:protein FMN transferase [Gammaproteobacteria bacterium]